MEFSYFVPLLFISCFILWFILKRTFVSILILILLQFFILQGSEEISIIEIAVGSLQFIIFGLWFIKRWFITQKPALEDYTDYSLGIFLFICTFSLIPGLILGGDSSLWFRELLRFLSLLLLFPLRDSIKNKKDIHRLLFVVLFLCLLIALRNLVQYRNAVVIAQQFWQFTSARVTTNEPLLFVPIIISVCIFLFSPSRKMKIAMAVLIVIFGISLAVTFSRGYWIAAVLGISFMFIFLPVRIKYRSLLYFGLLTSLAGIIIILFFGDAAKFILESLSERFLTLSNFLKDPSIRNRILESEALIKNIRSNPILGSGLGMHYNFNSILPREMPTTYVHNSFLYLFFKTWIFGLLFFFIFYIGMIRKGIQAFRTQNDPFLKAVLLGVSSCFLAMIPLSLSSPQFYQKDSVLLIGIGMAIIYAAGRISASPTELR